MEVHLVCVLTALNASTGGENICLSYIQGNTACARTPIVQRKNLRYQMFTQFQGGVFFFFLNQPEIR